MSFVLHCGAHKVERDQVAEVATPQATDTWFPIPHNELIELVERKLPDYGLTIGEQSHALMRDEHRYFGMMQVIPASNAPQDYGLVLGLRNSHDKSFPAGLCLGSQVFICDNLAFSAEVVIGRRHTRHIMDDLPRLIAAALGRLVDARLDQDRRIDAYKQAGITDEQAAHLIFMANEAKAIKPTHATKIWDEWRNPRHEEFAEEDNVWRLMNAITEIQKGINPFELQQRTQRMHPLLDGAAGITIGATSVEIDGDIEDAEFTIRGEETTLLALPAPQDEEGDSGL